MAFVEWKLPGVLLSFGGSPHKLDRAANRLSFYGEPTNARYAPSEGTPPAATCTPPRRRSLHVERQNRARWPPYAPFCSDGIGPSVLPGALRLLGLAPVGCRRLTRSRVNVTAGRIILDAGCVVSAPLPVLSGPPLARGHRSEGGGTFLSGPEGPPSAVRGLLAARAIHGGLFGVADVWGSESAIAQNSNIETAWEPGGTRPCSHSGPRRAYGWS